MNVVDAESGIVAIGTVVAAGAAVWLAYQNRKIVSDNDQLANAALQVRLDNQRPILIPMAVQHYFSAVNNVQFRAGYDINSPTLYIGLKNAGPGIALDVLGVVFGPARFGMNDTRHVLSLGTPMEAGGQVPPPDGQLAWPRQSGFGGETMLKVLGDDHIGKPPLTLHPPDDALARMTLTASDVFGRKHLATYDLYEMAGAPTWRCVRMEDNTASDLGDLSQTPR